VKVLLYRRSLDLDSGAGQLMLMQARGLEASGVDVQLACHHGGIEFFLRTGWLPRRVSGTKLAALKRTSACIVVDHGMEIAAADLVFVHNVAAEANEYLQRGDVAERAAREAVFFGALERDTPIVANSQLAKAALIKHFGLAAERIAVHYPGFQADKFQARRTQALRLRARRALHVDAATPLIGFVTSGDFHKRGLDLFVDAAAEIARAVPNARFLVVGSKRLPDWALQHSLVVDGTLLHRPKNRRPELMLAALDVFLYAARFEEFGMVVLEAQACGIPIVTSRRVGAAECLPPCYEPWLLDAPDASRFAAMTVALLADPRARSELAAAGIDNAAAFDHRAHERGAIAAIRALETAA
jgi:glycosyltransferase involved in cell wall biosynthesis